MPRVEEGVGNRSNGGVRRRVGRHPALSEETPRVLGAPNGIRRSGTRDTPAGNVDFESETVPLGSVHAHAHSARDAAIAPVEIFRWVTVGHDRTVHEYAGRRR